MAENTAPPSTPTASCQLFSSDAPANNESSPPSSPPAFPWELKDTSAESQERVKQSYHALPRNVFSVLGKRKLAPLSNNVLTAASKKGKRSDDGKTQMQLQLGQKIQKTCKECGMQYVASSIEDRALHAKFHKQHTEGVDVGVTFVESASTGLGRRIYDGVAERNADKIVVVDRFDKKPRRRKGQEVLEVVQRDLGAVEIAEADVWETPLEDTEEPRYRSFMYVRDGKCVGFLLVEKIKEAFEVLPPKMSPMKTSRATPPPNEPPGKRKTSSLAALQARRLAAETARAEKEALMQAASKKPLVLSEIKRPALLGISRIWTLPSHRGQGIAISLLDAAVQWYNGHLRFLQQQLSDTEQKSEAEPAGGKESSVKTAVADERVHALKPIERREQVAFSQPTAAGTKLARKWTGKMSGWSVYIDC